MRLIRKTTPDGKCKYAAIRHDRMHLLPQGVKPFINHALEVLSDYGLLEDPAIGDAEEFFLIKLKDINAADALTTYAYRAKFTDPELAQDVEALVIRSIHHRDKKQPD